MSTSSEKSLGTIAQVNDYKIRTIAFFVFVLAVGYLFTKLFIIPLLLLLDFGLRSFDLGKYSPLAIASDWVVKTFKLPVKLIYFPPKRFAARIGLSFAVAITITHLLGGLSAFALTGILAFFAGLEAFLGFCTGCHVYNFLQPFLQKKY